MENLRLLRFEFGNKTQSETARGIGISQSYYSLLESGVVKPSKRVKMKINKYFNGKIF